MSGTELINMAAFQGQVPSAAFKAALDPHAESLADGIGQSYGIIGYKGKVWSLRLRGQSYMFTRADDGSPAAFLDVIVLRSPPYKSKSYYPAGSFQDGQVGERPTCAALDGATPDVDIPAPQSNSCSVCLRNVFKLNAEGRKTRECSDYKRLSVLILPSMTKALLGAPLMESVFLRVPAASLNDLAQLGEQMSAQGFHYSSYITRIGFDPTKPHPQMTFRALQPLTDREAPLVLPLREEAQAKRITGESDVGNKTVRPALPPSGAAATTAVDPGAAADAAAAGAAAVAEAQRKAAEEAAAKEVARKAAEALAAKQAADKAAADEAARVAAAAAAAQAQSAGVVDTGFGDLTGDAPAPAATVTAAVSDQTTVLPPPGPVGANTVSDTGQAESADEALDARIAGLLPK